MKKTSAMLSLTLVLLLSSVVGAKAKYPKTSQEVSIDGNMVKMESYLINDKNHVKIRDLAALLKDTESSFNVTYNEAKNKVSLTNHQAYQKLSTDLQPLKDANYAYFNHSSFEIDGKDQSVSTVLINGNNYVQLRDLSTYIDFGLDYNEKTKTVEIFTSREGKLKGKVDKKYLTARFYSLIDQGFTLREAELVERVNEYRRQVGKPEFSVSKSLTEVARAHVKDSETYKPYEAKDRRGIKGNLHSWSANGNWSPVVYTPDHTFASGMWDKPREITSYQGDGFEISAMGYGSPEEFLEGWKSSPSHNKVIVGDKGWDDLKVMGVGIGNSFSHIWFGKDEDPAGYYWKNEN